MMESNSPIHVLELANFLDERRIRMEKRGINGYHVPPNK
jgi:hypothetical protein